MSTHGMGGDIVALCLGAFLGTVVSSAIVLATSGASPSFIAPQRGLGPIPNDRVVPVSKCPGDFDLDGKVSVAELTKVVGAALTGCPKYPK